MILQILSKQEYHFVVFRQFRSNWNTSSLRQHLTNRYVILICLKSITGMRVK